MQRRVSHVVDGGNITAMVRQENQQLHEAVLRGYDERCAALRIQVLHRIMTKTAIAATEINQEQQTNRYNNSKR